MREIYDVIIALEAMAAELLASMKSSERSRIADDLDRETASMEEALARATWWLGPMPMTGSTVFLSSGAATAASGE